MSLRTLKDLIEENKDGHDFADVCWVACEYGDCSKMGENCKVIHVSDLRQSAIEWIKAIENNEVEPFFVKDGNKIVVEPLILTFWIKHFFGISEEDLK
jgi:hypothetical protein